MDPHMTIRLSIGTSDDNSRGKINEFEKKKQYQNGYIMIID